jgi:hypothetical protein
VEGALSAPGARGEVSGAAKKVPSAQFRTSWYCVRLEVDVKAPAVVTMFDRIGIPVTERALLSAFAAALADRGVPSAGADLSASAAAVLAEHGGLDVPLGSTAAADLVVTTTAEHAAMVELALTVTAAAARLGIDASRVRHRISARELYAVTVHGRKRLPAWQFTARGPVPGLKQVLPALPHDLHPLEVEEFFTSPQPGLILRDEEVSPTEWLAGGGDTAVVRSAAESLTVAP